MNKKRPKKTNSDIWNIKNKNGKKSYLKQDNIYSVLGKTIEANMALGIYSAFSKSLKK